MRRLKTSYRWTSRVLVSFGLMLSVIGGSLVAPTPVAAQSSAPVNFQGECKPDPNNPASELSAQNCSIIAYLVVFINTLSAIAGVVIVLMIVYSGILYAGAKDNPQVITRAKERIRDALIALVALIFMFSFLQWVVPGGVIIT